MKTFVLIYNTCVIYEVILSCHFMITNGDIITVGLNDKNVLSIER
jgi:hypothetical protein